MATHFELHPTTPQARTIQQIAKALAGGAIMLYPTDTVYAIGCDINVKSAVQRVRQIKQLANEKPLTFLCPSLSNIAQYAYVSDTAYRTIRRLVPGTYTFLLPATKLVPRLVQSPKRKTTGIRVPDRVSCQALLAELGMPIASTSAYLLDGEGAGIAETIGAIDKAELFDHWESLVDLIIDDEPDEPQTQSDRLSTILDLTGESPEIIRKGEGWEAAMNWI